MKLILLLIIIGGVAVLFRETRARARRDREGSALPPERMMSADEAPPTETGRMRASGIVDAIRAQHETSPPSFANASADSAASESEAEDQQSGSAAPLPDPFDSGKQERPKRD